MRTEFKTLRGVLFLFFAVNMLLTGCAETGPTAFSSHMGSDVDRGGGLRHQIARR